MITKLDARKQIQHRFHPPVNFPVRDAEQSANGKPQRPSNAEYISSTNSSAFPGPIFSGAYDSYNVGPPSEFLDNDEPPASKPIFSKYPPEKDEVRKCLRNECFLSPESLSF